ncbi:hypothetical protein TA3x_000804 [Tundrisphaera sp. TA3]|uniref:hypothetical protein n=1 Tax=Tundrisphaera sp. TA3 TaxID=3435775 RepID=UPI003EBD4C11
MALVACEISDGLRASEATVAVREVVGDRQYLRVERDFLTEDAGRYYLSVALIQMDPTGASALIELPQEADSGTSRLWVPASDLRQKRSAEPVAS